MISLSEKFRILSSKDMTHVKITSCRGYLYPIFANVTGGLSVFGCSESRGYRLAVTDFVNISYGERMEHGNPMNESSENWRLMTASTSSPKRNIRQSPKVSPQMRLAKKGLEKLNKDILSQLESNKKMMFKPCKVSEAKSQEPQTASPSQSEFQTLWNELHSLQVSAVTQTYY